MNPSKNIYRNKLYCYSYCSCFTFLSLAFSVRVLSCYRAHFMNEFSTKKGSVQNGLVQNGLHHGIHKAVIECVGKTR